VEKKSVVQVGGTIEKALSGEYSIDVKGVLSEAWTNTLKSRVSINIGLMLTFAIGMIATLFISSFMGGVEAVFNDAKSSAMLNIMVTLIVYPFLVGVEMMGVFHAVGLKTKPKLVFAFLKRGSWVALCALLVSTLITIGLNLFYLPGIFLAVALSLVLPLVVEKQLSPLKAILLSIQALRHQWFQVCLSYFSLIFLVLAALMPLILMAKSELSVIGGVFFLFCLTYIAPLFYNVKGILYREIFGMQLTVTNQSNDSSDDNSDESNGNHTDTTFSA
jgi:hypothetical protein